MVLTKIKNPPTLKVIKSILEHFMNNMGFFEGNIRYQQKEKKPKSKRQVQKPWIQQS